MFYNRRIGLLVALLLLLRLQLLQRFAEARCTRPEDLPNGSFNVRRAFIRFRCDPGYTLKGDAFLSCGLNDRLSGERPFCAKPGCKTPLNPEFGITQMRDEFTSVVTCNDEYVVAGHALAYCNGRSWDRTLGVCRHRDHGQSHACDFETEDMCGWTTQWSDFQPWRRVATVTHFHSYRTGPRHDHTLQHAYGGHYMLMESSFRVHGVPHFNSPIYPRELSLKTACCFRFHYFMYGSGVGTLVVSVKPYQLRVSQMWTDRTDYEKFRISGNQGNQWLEHTISIDEMEQDFQVVFSVDDATAQFGDIAIDDVRLMTGSECGGAGITTTTEPPIQDTVEPVVFDIMNCSQRCGEAAPLDDLLRADGKLIKSCGCDEQCVDQDNCCADYTDSCLIGSTETIPEDLPTSPSTTTTTTTTTTPKPTTRRTTTTTTTTTTPKPTTTTTTTTTTRKPTTRQATTTTTKRIPVTKPTTTTTTTRRTTTTTKATTTTRRTPKPPSKTTTTTTTTVRSTMSTARTTRQSKRISWPVHPDDMKDESDRKSSSNSARFMWLLMLAIVVSIVAASIAYRWKRPTREGIEKSVSFQKTISKLRRATRSRQRPNSQLDPLCENENEDYEEVGVSIRNLTEL